MRTARVVLTGVVALASAGFIPAPAQAADPSAPYTALTIDGGPGSWWHQGSLVYDPTNGSTFTAAATGTDQVDFRAERGSDNWVFRLAPPTGSTWTDDTEYDISLAPSDTQAYVDVQHAGSTCDEAPGKLQVRDVVRDGDGTLTGFAATFLISCFSSYHDLRGELRWNSDAPYVAAATDVMSHNFGNHLVGSGPFTKAITVTSLGAAPTEFGEVSFYENSGSYAVTGNTCTGTSRAYGETCTVTVSANATKLGSDYTILKLADNTALGGRSVQLGMVGIDPRTVTVSPTTLYFDNETLYEVGTPQRVTVTSTGSSPISYSAARVTGADAADFVITNDGCKGKTLASGQSCYVDVAAKPSGSGFKYGTLELPDNSLSSPKTVQLSISNARQGLRGTYTPVEPQRILDSRSGLGVRKGLVPAGGVVRLQVAGRGGIPDQGVSAVVLNVTVTDTTGSGHLTVYPAGVTRPTASSLNYVKGGLRSNSVTVQLSASGQVDIATNQGAHIIADVTGWYASSGYPSGYALGGQIQPTEPWRLFDSRSYWGEPLPGGAYTQLAVDFENLNSRIKAMIVNITAVNPTSRGYLTAWDGANGRPPTTSTVNYLAGTVTPNFAIVPVGPCHICEGEFEGVPSIGIFSSVTSHVVVDVVGLVDDGTLPNGLRFEPRTPQRIVDSRQGLGVPGKLGGGATRTVTAPASVLPTDTRALALNVTGVAPTANTYLSVWPTGLDRPAPTTLNLAAGQTAANAALALLGGTNLNQFNIYNNSGSTDVVSDVVGAFWLYPGTATSTGVQDRRGSGNGATALRPAEPGPRELGSPTPRPRRI